MNKNELRAIVEAVVEVLAERGYLTKGASGLVPPSSPSAARGQQSRFARTGDVAPRVTIGSAGKVFSQPLVRAVIG